ncbi:unnamed protein product [Rotaria sordida]|uniref:Uncharacterized protein n=1 Tax=Rotaria sordida TaxID=392033 RepID=A0A818KXB6_9BILA|nr:unnamed protein product [Rotaria sordida]CAF1008319.1 unnamed protein product [Rotaria sordida]CAF1045548.1 unnamed protein product [Rotaria sordida]CAF1480091.1 unnamed protein product [Rotaria sordida]CAF3564787.1 unnamed protein product [Rotaria sordida]
MVDIARVYSPVVVFPSSEARPQSSDRIRSASAKRLSSPSTHRTSRISSAVSTIESDGSSRSRYYTNDINDEKDLKTELQAELTTPLTGINLLELINNKIAKLDRALRSVEAPSDASKNQALITSEKLRANAIQNGQSRQQVQQFAGLLAFKSTFQDQITATVKPKASSNTLLDQDQSTLLEIFQYPGFEEHRVSPLPFNISLDRQVMRHVLPKRYTLSKQAPYIKSLIELYYSMPTKALILDIFWWIFLEHYQSQPKIQKQLLQRCSNNYVALLMMELDLRYRDKCFQVYPSLLAETVFACFKVCFPASIKQMPADAEAAGKTNDENKNAPFELGNISDTPGQRMKELVNLDAFKNSISNICQLWLGGIPAPPRRYEQWRSKIVQQEKISFKETTPPISSPVAPITTTTTAAPSAPHASLAMPSTSHSSVIDGAKTSGSESAGSSSYHVSFKLNKRKEPHELLDEMYKHTYDPLPDRRVLYEDYRFDLNGNSPLTEKFLRSSQMLKNTGTQLYISHPQIIQVPSVSAETYDNEIKRAAKICRIIRAQKHKERTEQQAQRYRQAARQRAATSKTRDELEKQAKKGFIYRLPIKNRRSDDLISISQLSFKSHQ